MGAETASGRAEREVFGTDLPLERWSMAARRPEKGKRVMDGWMEPEIGSSGSKGGMRIEE